MCLGGSRQDRITLPDLLHIQMMFFNHSDHLIFFLFTMQADRTAVRRADRHLVIDHAHQGKDIPEVVFLLIKERVHLCEKSPLPSR